jgi:hypothetical protein
MAEEPEVRVHRGAPTKAAKRLAEFPTPTAVITHRGCKMVLRFADVNDLAGEGELQSVELRPADGSLDPAAVRWFVPHFALYLAYARAAMRIWGSEEGTTEERRDAFRRSAEPLREIGGPGRGLPDEFYRRIADNYRDLVAEGEPHPIKALAQIHNVTISGASRWVSGARQRGYLPEKEKR